MKYISIVLFAALFIVFAASPFFGDDQEFFSYYVTPDIWIILDTSGSMTWDMAGCPTYGDGSGTEANGYLGRDTDGDGIPHDARIYIVKDAIRNMILDPEIDIRWGLSTFYQDIYWGSSDGQYRVPDSGTYPLWSICNPPWFAHSNPDMWWHGATETYAYEAFMMRVQLAEGAPSHINEIESYMDHIVGTSPKKEFHAQGGTPIAGALRGVRYEYMSTIPMDNAKWCRGYYVILLSDGEPTYGIDQATYDQGKNALWGPYDAASPQWMKNQCYWEAESLMNTYIAAQGPDPDTVLPVKTYVIGIGNEGGGTLDTIAICGGTEQYYPATNPDELAEVLRSIVSDIMNAATSYSGSEVTSIQEQFINTSYEARLYLCSFVPSYAPIWEGHMKAVKLVEGTLNIDSIPDSLLYWDAGEVMDTMAMGSRTIYTEKGYALIPFNTGTISPFDLDVATNGERDTLVHIVYAGHIKSTTGYLGDIFHSTPLRIRGPNYFYEDDNFYIFRETMNATRDPVLYAGSNTGMVHCISDSTGEELWAFIPNDQLPNLKSLLVAHRYFQDANVMAADIWYPSVAADSFKDEDEWKTVMFCGQRQGGHNYSVLDVTDPYNPDFLFNFDTSMADLGQTWSNPVMFKIHKNTFDPVDERFFAFLGGGYYNDTLYDIYSPDPLATPPGTGIYALDIVQMDGDPAPVLGTDYWKLPVADPVRDTMYWTFPSQASVIDTNLDTYADLLFIGDWAGQLWKVVINSMDSTELIIDDWEAEIIFKAPRPVKAVEEHFWQPIFFPSTAAWDGRRWWIFFGTGDRANASKEGTINRYYAIVDSSYAEPLTEDTLKRIPVDGPLTELELVSNQYKGWYFLFTDFDNTDSIGKRLGEKVTSFGTVLMDTLIFTTFQPYDQNDPCINANGIARLYKVHYKMGSYNGTAPSTIVGSGLPQAPRYSFTISGEGMQIINLPGEVVVQPAPSLGIRRRLLWWHEIQ